MAASLVRVAGLVAPHGPMTGYLANWLIKDSHGYADSDQGAVSVTVALSPSGDESASVISPGPVA